MIGIIINGWQGWRGGRVLICTDVITGSSFCVTESDILVDWGAIHRRLTEKRAQFGEAKRGAILSRPGGSKAKTAAAQ